MNGECKRSPELEAAAVAHCLAAELHRRRDCPPGRLVTESIRRHRRCPLLCSPHPGMKQALIVGLGGFIGSIGRYKLGGFILHRSVDWRFPLSTFAINVAGCFLIGLLAALAEHRGFFSAETRLFLFTGLLGGFTTFSAFGSEGMLLIRRGEFAVAVAYAFASVVCAFAAVWVGFQLARKVSGA
jgi:CrcB protein